MKKEGEGGDEESGGEKMKETKERGKKNSKKEK